jgi:hypothetical protein
LYGSLLSSHRKFESLKNYSRIQAAEINFLWSIAGYASIDCKRNENNRKRNIFSLKERIMEYKKNDKNI